VVGGWIESGGQMSKRETVSSTGTRNAPASGRLTRRLTVLLGLALLGAMAYTAAPAGAVIVPTGAVTVTVSNINFSLTVTGTPTTVGPFSGTMTGTVDATGHLTFPKAGINFPAFDTTIVVPATVHAVALGPWSGTIDPSTGAVSVTGPAETLATVATLGLVDCPVGPVTIAAQTGAAGGVKYSTSTGKATLADPAFQIPAIPAGQAGCNGQEATVNTALGLPGSGGITMTLAFAPTLTGNGAPPPSTTTFTTTTTTRPATTTTPSTTAPITTSALPRTGSSTGTLAIIGISVVLAGIGLSATRRRGPRTQPPPA
jgi:LPXTG-motif cell wall-anchored protein